MSTVKEKKGAYAITCLVILFILAVLFTFPLYWILTGSLKTQIEINSATPTLWPQVFTLENYQKLLASKMNLFEINAFGYTITGPAIASAIKWLLNTVIMAVAAMLLTCLTAAMAGYVLAKKRFYGRDFIFGLMVRTKLICVCPRQSSNKLFIGLNTVDNIQGVVQNYPTMFCLFRNLSGMWIEQSISAVRTKLMDEMRDGKWIPLCPIPVL